MLSCLPLLLLVALTSMVTGERRIRLPLELEEDKKNGKGKKGKAKGMSPPSFDDCPDISGGWSTRSPVNSYISVLLANGTVDDSSIPYEHALDLTNFPGTTCAFAGFAFGRPSGAPLSVETAIDPVNGAFTVSSSDASFCFTVTWLFDPDTPVTIEGRGCVTDDRDVINFAFTTTAKSESMSTFTGRMQLHRMTNVELCGFLGRGGYFGGYRGGGVGWLDND